MAERGREVIARLVDHIDIRRIVYDMSRLKDFEDDEALSLGPCRLQRQVRGLRIWKDPSGLLGSFLCPETAYSPILAFCLAQESFRVHVLLKTRWPSFESLSRW